MANVLPLKVSGALTTAAVRALVPFPVRRPPSVVEPVPPLATPSVPVSWLVPIDEVAIIWPALLTARTALARLVRVVLPVMVTLPPRYDAPLTSSGCVGDVVPTPKSPAVMYVPPLPLGVIEMPPLVLTAEIVLPAISILPGSVPLVKRTGLPLEVVNASPPVICVEPWS